MNKRSKIFTVIMLAMFYFTGCAQLVAKEVSEENKKVTQSSMKSLINDTKTDYTDVNKDTLQEYFNDETGLKIAVEVNTSNENKNYSNVKINVSNPTNNKFYIEQINILENTHEKNYSFSKLKYKNIGENIYVIDANSIVPKDFSKNFLLDSNDSFTFEFNYNVNDKVNNIFNIDFFARNNDEIFYVRN